MDPHVVVLEDDLELRSLVTRGLREEGFRVTSAGSAAEVLALVDGPRPDALVVDIGLPDADGRDVVQALRAQGLTTPVIFLTARDALTDRLSGFAAGGDDYLDEAVCVRGARRPAARAREAGRQRPRRPRRPT